MHENLSLTSQKRIGSTYSMDTVLLYDATHVRQARKQCQF